MCALSFAQLENRSSRAMTNCASASFAVTWGASGESGVTELLRAAANRDSASASPAFTARSNSLARFFCCSRLRRNAEGARSVRSFITIPFRYACARLRQKRDWDKNKVPNQVVGAARDGPARDGPALSADVDA